MDFRVRLDDVIHNAYWKAEKYIKRFEPIRINFEIDVNMDARTLKAERGNFLRKLDSGLLETYNLCYRYRSIA